MRAKPRIALGLPQTVRRSPHFAGVDAFPIPGVRNVT